MKFDDNNLLLNINDIVKVKFNDYGKSAYCEYFSVKTIPLYKDGYVKIKLCDLIEITRISQVGHILNNNWIKIGYKDVDE